jgi:signal transduction histidine kinase
MSAEELLRYLSDAGYLLVFALTLIEALRRPSRTTLDACILFGVAAGVVVISLAREAAGGEAPAAVVAFQAALIMAMPYMLLRLVADFPGMPRRLLRAAGAVLVLTVASLFAVSQEYPAAYLLVLVGIFVVEGTYASWQFIMHARRAAGVTRRRMQAAATGSALIGAVILVVGLSVVAPGAEGVWSALADVLALASVVSYYLGFATPGFLRRAWRADAVRRFLTVAASGPQTDTTAARFSPEAVASLETQIAAIIGAERVMIALWDAARERLVTTGREARPDGPRAVEREQTPTYRAFREQRGLFVADAARSDTVNADIYRALGVKALLVTPITSGDHRLGVLVAYSGQSALFANDDLSLLRVLAAQIATFMVMRELVATAASVEAREEATRLKEDFLSAAAHDLKTPLTTLLGQAQLMQRRLRRDEHWTPDPAPVDRMVDEALRMRRLVEDLLDASRSEQGGFITRLEVVDLEELAREVVEHVPVRDHQLAVRGERTLTTADRNRLRQVVQNLVENAIKYSPDGGRVTVAVARQDGKARLTVSDEGVGIPVADQPVIFDRFQRGSRAGDRRFAGMGVGVYLCKSIVDEHGGRIWVESTPGTGSSFHVELPVCGELEGA